MKLSELIRPLIRARFIDIVQVMDNGKVVYADEPRKKLISREIYNREVEGSYSTERGIVVTLEPKFERLTAKHWRNFDPWECCGQDSYCKRGCHEEGGCTKGCIVPKLYDKLAQYEDLGLTPQEIERMKNKLSPKK